MAGSASRKRINPYILWGGLWIAFDVLWNISFPPHTPALRTFAHVYSVLPGLAAGWLLSKTGRESGAKKNSLIWFFCAGLVSWLIRDMYAGFHSTGSIAAAWNHLPLPWFTGIGTGMFLISSLFLPAFKQNQSYRLKLMLDLVISAGSLVLICWLVLFPPSSSNAPASRSLQSDLLQELALTAVWINLLLVHRQPDLRRSLASQTAAFVFFFCSDMISVYTISGSDPAASITRLLAYLSLYDASLHLTRWNLNPEHEFSEMDVLHQSLGNRVQSILPIALGLVMLAELLMFWQLNLPLSQTIVEVASVTWLLLITRLGVTAGEFETQHYLWMFLNSGEPAILCDSRFRLLHANPAMVRLGGYTCEQELLHLHLGDLVTGTPDRLERQQPFQVETSLFTVSQRQIPVDLSLQLVELGVFKRKLITGTLHDLTLQKEQQENLQKAYENLNQVQHELQILNEDLELRVAAETRSLSEAYLQLEEQNVRLQSLDEMKSDFVSLVSHELRAPLANISGGLELLLSRKKQLPESARESLVMVQAETRRLTRFVETILDLSMLDAGKMPLYPEVIRVSELRQDLQAHYRSFPEANRLVWNFSAEALSVMADRQALMSVFLHVIDNAIKYAPEGQVMISACNQNESVLWSVSDSGQGIPAGIRENIFEEFYRGENSDARKIYGHGLGLYMARKLLLAMGGEIRAGASADGGAQFDFWLPIWRDEEDEPNSAGG